MINTGIKMWWRMLMAFAILLVITFIPTSIVYSVITDRFSFTELITIHATGWGFVVATFSVALLFHRK